MIDRLERAGFVRRVRDGRDRRKVLVEVLPLDEEKVAPLFESALVATEKVLEKFTPAERDVIERYQNEMTVLMREDILGGNP